MLSTTILSAIDLELNLELKMDQLKITDWTLSFFIK